MQVTNAQASSFIFAAVGDYGKNSYVDLLLQGHSHSYHRSKQLALSPACPSITVGGYNSSCVVDDGADGSFTKDRGAITVISGAGGISLYNLDPTAPEAGYFTRWMGKNINPTYGFLSPTVNCPRSSSGQPKERSATVS